MNRWEELQWSHVEIKSSVQHVVSGTQGSDIDPVMAGWADHEGK